MAGLTLSPGELAAALCELSVQVEAVEVTQSGVPLPDYPGGPRPSSVLRVAGGGHAGFGENVAFDVAEHERFASYARAWFQAQASQAALRIGDALGPGGTQYERAALEAALIDLALRQAELSLFEVCGAREVALRFVASFAAGSDPAHVIAEQRAQGYTGGYKVDVDPNWNQAIIDVLAREPGIAILDFKTRCEPQFARHLAACVPHALLEDPPLGLTALDATPQRISRDAPLLDASTVAQAVARGEAVNLKAPRMGGPLAVLRGLEHAWRAGTLAYLGGMFEVSVGRAQAQQLAALYCAAAPNDLAPNVPSTHLAMAERSDSPLTIRLDEPGFGSSAAQRAP